jgi:predicted metal-dependent hydrolase
VKIILAILLITSLFNSGWSQTINYEDVFGDDWKKALAFEKENRSWMEPLLSKNHISYPLAVAVVFPELVRYSALRDKMEITLLKALYINLGDQYANFSIGQFQMKPSFAEMIREQASAILGRRSGIIFKNRSDFDDIRSFRKSIVIDLEDPKSQFSYLVAFLKICEKKYKTNRKDEVSRLRFLATAYNYGIDKSAALIESMIDKKFFNTKLFKTENYSYAEVSLFWYKEYMQAYN